MGPETLQELLEQRTDLNKAEARRAEGLRFGRSWAGETFGSMAYA